MTRDLLRLSRILRGAGFVVLGAGLAWLAVMEQVGWSMALIVAGCIVSMAGAMTQARLETQRDASTRNAMRYLVAAAGLRLAAIPLVATGGGWLAWGMGPGLAAEIAFVGLGVCAFAYGLIARIDGVSQLEPNVPKWRNHA